MNSNIINQSNLISRDLSWLNFNYRVLDQVKDKNRGVLDKLKFLSIVSSTASSETNFQPVSLSGTVFANNETSLSYQTGGCIAEVSSQSLTSWKTYQGPDLGRKNPHGARTVVTKGLQVAPLVGALQHTLQGIHLICRPRGP